MSNISIKPGTNAKQEPTNRVTPRSPTPHLHCSLAPERDCEDSFANLGLTSLPTSTLYAAGKVECQSQLLWAFSCHTSGCTADPYVTWVLRRWRLLANMQSQHPRSPGSCTPNQATWKQLYLHEQPVPQHRLWTPATQGACHPCAGGFMNLYFPRKPEVTLESVTLAFWPSSSLRQNCSFSFTRKPVYFLLLNLISTLPVSLNVSICLFIVKNMEEQKKCRQFCSSF